MNPLLSLPLLAGLLLLSGCYTNPVTGRRSLVLLSEGREAQLGSESFQQIRRKEKVATDPGANARVQRVGQRIAAVVGEALPAARWEFVVFESKELNAFALPGGKVGVYTGLLELAESDAELATVMGHEIGHVVARHGAERMSEAMVIAGVGIAGSLAVEANSNDPRMRDLFALAYGGGTTLLRVLPHSRANEGEADRMGMLFAARAGYDPRGAVSFWRKMAARKQASAPGPRTPTFLSTHPADERRIADLEAFLPAVLPVWEQALGARRADAD
ncbi:MAG: M48 family metallopeptidase [Verrucomicrobia bacterium]|nr:M48 family metallopeptidase [Verrucomicrobiota bacterium]